MNDNLPQQEPSQPDPVRWLGRFGWQDFAGPVLVNIIAGIFLIYLTTLFAEALPALLYKHIDSIIVGVACVCFIAAIFYFRRFGRKVLLIGAGTVAIVLTFVCASLIFSNSPMWCNNNEILFIDFKIEGYRTGPISGIEIDRRTTSVVVTIPSSVNNLFISANLRSQGKSGGISETLFSCSWVSLQADQITPLDTCETHYELDPKDSTYTAVVDLNYSTCRRSYSQRLDIIKRSSP